MDGEMLFPLLVTTVVAIVGWVVGHQFNAHRDQKKKRREIRTEYLIRAYRGLEDGASRGSIAGTEYGGKFESAIADIQLFGTEDQDRMAKELANAIAERRNDASSGHLLLSLRDDLRKEIGLDVIKKAPIHLRFTR